MKKIKNNLLNSKLIYLLFLASQYFNIANSQGQNTYQLSWKRDIPIASTTIGIGTAAFFLHKNKFVLTEHDIVNLQISEINRFDRSATRQWNTKIALASDIGWYGSMTFPALLFIDRRVSKEYRTILTMWSETFLANMAITAITKNTINRKRPYVYNSDVPMSNKLNKDASASFFSGHTSMTSASCFFTAKIYADMHPDSRFKSLVWTGAALLPATIGLFRYKAGKHYFTDILTGYAVGALIGILVPQIHKITD
jgi:membrane-associated phospholipid phosphatase